MAPTKGTKRQSVRCDDDLWTRYGDAVGDRSADLRAYMEWRIANPEAPLPQRPRKARTTVQ